MSRTTVKHSKKPEEDIKRVKSGKSPGPDNFHPEFLKYFGRKTLPVLLDLYNYSWNTGVPAIWKKVTIVPILKSNKPSDNLSSCRPISKTSILSKVGFRKWMPTTQQVTLLSQSIKDTLDQKCSVLAVFVDFEAAFDKV
ncbi:uncharacterized protein TNCV_3004981 [Trichonephila clavipes]|nr:uncharacterized protein TNCV_3004981 [Trichonephila clavipes]